LVSDKPNVKLANPLADYMNTARNSLVPNMLDAVAENEKRGYPDLAMFEVGTVFDGPDPGDEHKQIVIARAGAAEKRHWLKRERPVDIFDVKADLLAYVGKAETKTDNPPMWAHPYRYGRLVRDGKTLGEFGQLHPKLAKYWKIKTPVVLGVIDDISYIKNYCHPRGGGDRISHIAENNFQPITRDFSFALKGELPAEKIVAAAKSADPQIKSVTEFDFYENSVAFEITLEPARNLTDADLLEIQNKVTASVEKLGAKIRDK
jgi:phenylalanyl-tRNA synthetase beta chain